MPWFGTAQLKWYTNSILDWRVHLAFLETSVKAHLISQNPTIMRGFSYQIYLVYLRTQIHFPIGGARSRVVGQNSLTFLGVKNSLTPLENNNLNFGLARDQLVLLETEQIC